MAWLVTKEDTDAYMRSLLERHDEDVLVEMEKLAADKNFPIVNRHVGVTLEMLSRLLNAKRVFELGSGYGYSAYWFARVAAEVQCTDGDAENAKMAEAFLTRAGLWDRISFHVGDAVTELGKVPGEFDIVYNDIDKHGYPDAWRAARSRVRVGGLYICDNVLWSGRVVTSDPDDQRPAWTAAIKEHNELIASDGDFLSSILPIRDGVMVALRLR